MSNNHDTSHQICVSFANLPSIVGMTLNDRFAARTQEIDGDESGKLQ